MLLHFKCENRHSMMYKQILLLSVFFLQFAIATPSLAATVRLSLSEAINFALENNEDIEESFRRIDAAEADVMSAKGGYDLNVFADVRYGTLPNVDSDDFDTEVPPNATRNYFKTDVGISQRIPTGATLRTFYTYSYEERLGIGNQDRFFNKSYLTVELTQSLLRGIGDKELQSKIKTAILAVEDSVEARSLSVSQITLSVIRAYWALATAQNNLKVSQEVLKMAKEVLRRELVRFDEGISQGVDVDRAKLAVEQRQYTVVQYERDEETAKDYLLLLINAPNISADAKIIPTSPLVKMSAVELPSEKYSLDLALSNRYELKQADIILKQLDLEYDVNTNTLLPRLDVVIGATTSNGNDYIRGADGFNDTDSTPSAYAGMNFSYPLQNREARGAVKRTKQLIRIAQERMRKTRRTIVTEVKGVLHNFTMAKNGLPLAEKSYNLAKDVVKGEQTRFEMGGINNRDLLASHDALGREEMNYFLANVNFNVALAEYRFTCATMLQKYNITLSDDGAKMR